MLDAQKNQIALGVVISMNTIDRQRLKKLADKKIERELRPCRHCGNKSFNWDLILMIKTCKNNKCNDVSGVM